MRSRPFKCEEDRVCNREEIIKIEKALQKREKKLLKREETLQRKIKEHDRRANCRAKADLRAAKKLSKARRKLLFVLDSRDRQECNRKTKKIQKVKITAKGKQQKEKPFIDIIFDLCDRLVSGPGKQNSIIKSLADFTPYKPYSTRFQQEIRTSRNDSIRHNPRDNVWNLTAEDCYLKSLPRTPQPWIYHRWPTFYPHYLNVRHQCKNVGYLLLFMGGFLFWLPILVCLEICKCFFCACCCDCQ